MVCGGYGGKGDAGEEEVGLLAGLDLRLLGRRVER